MAACPICGLEKCNDSLFENAAAIVVDKGEGKMKSEAAVYFNAEKTQLVTGGDPAAAFLVVSAGRDVSAAELKALGVDLDQFREFASRYGSTESEDDDEAPKPRRTSRPARSGAGDKERQAPAQVKTGEGEGDGAGTGEGEDENLDDKNLAELRAIATEREVEIADDDDEDAIRVKLLDAAKTAEPQA